jgi:hypothetical protein
MKRRWFLLVVFFAGLGGIECMSLGGCAKPVDLPDVMVSAASPAEFAEFRADLSTRFAPDRLAPFDTATQELKLDAMNRDVPAAGRELDMLSRINGRTVQVAIVTGWKARKARFLREIAEIQGLLDGALQTQQRTAATGTPSSVLAQIQSANVILGQLHDNLADTERRLAEWSAAK